MDAKVDQVPQEPYRHGPDGGRRRTDAKAQEKADEPPGKRAVQQLYQLLTSHCETSITGGFKGAQSSPRSLNARSDIPLVSRPFSAHDLAMRRCAVPGL